MNGFDHLGRRIHELRKSHGMTQEELASRLGVSSQAVSKWEKESSYPDITLLPTIAAIFSVSMNHLFGVADEARSQAIPALPSHYEGLPLVHQYQNIGCYSDKPVEKLDTSSVKFVDGSVAELSNRLVTNYGVGGIRTLALDGDIPANAFDATVTSAEFVFEHTDALRVELLANNAEVVYVPGGKTRVLAKGHPQFIRLLNATAAEGMLSVSFQKSDGSHMGSAKENTLRIEVPYEAGRELNASVNGQGTFTCAIPYESGTLAINGCGEIYSGNIGNISISINGSGDVRTGESEVASVWINGAGDVDAQALGHLKATINGFGDIQAQRAASLTMGINGSGDVVIGSLSGGDVSTVVAGNSYLAISEGTCGKFDVRISGSGVINASGVTAETACIILDSDGDVTLGRVLRSSTEQIKKKGNIRILARGQA